MFLGFVKGARLANLGMKRAAFICIEKFLEYAGVAGCDDGVGVIGKWSES
jgi:hypothetical protein